MAQLHNLISMRERISVFASLGAGLAHDLNRPLTSARNFLSLARNLGAVPVDELLANAEYRLDRASAIVRHLREFAREGRPTISHDPLYPALAEVRELL